MLLFPSITNEKNDMDNNILPYIYNITQNNND